MKAAVIHAFGQPPRYEDFPEPTAAEGEVRVTVHAAGLHPVVRAIASGAHYTSANVLPLIPGVDGIGSLDDGTRVYFGLSRPPYGTMAEYAVVPRAMCFPIPDQLDDLTAAAVFNPAMSSWFVFIRTQLAQGETVLVLGATGAAGKLAVQMAKNFGAGKVIALGRNAQVLSQLSQLGADVTISLNQPEQELIEAISRSASNSRIDVIIDYLWGHPTEMVIAALARQVVTPSAPRVRLIVTGQTAGSTISLPASVLSSSGLEISGSGLGTISPERIRKEMPQLIAKVASSNLHIDTEAVPLSEIEAAWQRQTSDNRRLVVFPRLY
jgi:NADPH:quinone reductase-like Zn-dependent oxidoreductase